MSNKHGWLEVNRYFIPWITHQSATDVKHVLLKILTIHTIRRLIAQNDKI